MLLRREHKTGPLQFHNLPCQEMRPSGATLSIANVASLACRNLDLGTSSMLASPAHARSVPRPIPLPCEEVSAQSRRTPIPRSQWTPRVPKAFALCPVTRRHGTVLTFPAATFSIAPCQAFRFGWDFLTRSYKSRAFFLNVFFITGSLKRHFLWFVYS